MLSGGMRGAYGTIAALQLGIGIGLTVVLQRYLAIVADSLSAATLSDELSTYLPLGLFWGMVVPFYLNGLLGIIAAAVGKAPACAVYLTFCILGLLAGLPYGTFSIVMAIAAQALDLSLLSCSVSSLLTASCDINELGTLGQALAGLHGAGWFLTLVGAIFGCVGSCCSPSDNPAAVQPTVPMNVMVITNQPGQHPAQHGYAQPGYSQAHPGYGQAQPGYAQPQPGYAQAQPGYGQVQPGYGYAMQQPGASQPPQYADQYPQHPDPSNTGVYDTDKKC